jgi:hypothetical protein
MKLNFKGDRLLVAQARRARAQVRLGLSFGRFGEEVHSVTLRLSKVIDGGASGKRCEITVGIKPKRVRVMHTDAPVSQS